ncbi:MAG: hypothetical protein ACLRWQ_15070 [Flavonifractor plautii]
MATKEKLKTKAARVREEARETGKVILRAPALVRAAECVIRFLLGAMLSGAEIFGGYAPFGLGLVAASGSGLDGFCALLGACFGYLSFQGLRRGAAVRGRLHPGLLPGLCLLRREGLPQELVHAPGGGGDGRHHGLCVLI